MLTELQVKQAKPEAKPYKKADRNGLHLYVSPTGHKSWRFKYRHGGKEGRMVFGTYPDMSLAEAREVLDDTRKQLRQGIDPNVLKVRARLGVASAEGRTFESVAREWHEQQVDRWKPVHANDVITSMERDLFPDVGGCPVDQIDIAMMLAVLRKVEKRGAIETAHRLRQRAERVFRYARSIGIPNDNPAAELTEALKPVPKAKRWPALGSVEEIKPFLARIDLAGASPVTRLASRFLALVAQRPGMIRHAEWGEFKGIDWLDPASDVSNALWHIPAAKMKQELHLREDRAYDHYVPLAPEAVATLRKVRLLTGRARYVFCSSRSGQEPMSENAIGYLYNREGYKGRHVPHGWRSSFSTIMNARCERLYPGAERLIIDRLIIDLMLAHIPTGMSETELIYNRAAYLERRRELATVWAGLIMDGATALDEILESPRRRLA